MEHQSTKETSAGVTVQMSGKVPLIVLNRLGMLMWKKPREKKMKQTVCSLFRLQLRLNSIITRTPSYYHIAYWVIIVVSLLPTNEPREIARRLFSFLGAHDEPPCDVANGCENDGVCHNLCKDFWCDCPVPFTRGKRCEQCKYEKITRKCKTWEDSNSIPTTHYSVGSGATNIRQTSKDLVFITLRLCVLVYWWRYSRYMRLSVCVSVDCETNPCRNGGTCNRGQGELDEVNECTCFPGFTGYLCENEVEVQFELVDMNNEIPGASSNDTSTDV